jgi:NhaP-type Na+/H+ or K+/H+ antiporter
MIAELFSHHPALALVMTTAVVMVAGVAAQVVANRFAVPAILLLLGTGIVLGPEVLGLVRPDLYGVGLRALISLSVAVIVFEGAMQIDVRHLRHCSRSVLGLITVGAATTFLGATVVAHVLLGLNWKIAALFGAIVSVTGPTVIAPILKRLPLNHRLKTTLEAESVLVDAVGVLLTAAVFSYITASNLGVVGGVWQLVSNLATGTLVGGATALALALALKRSGVLPSDLVRLMVLGAALLAYSMAEAFAHESGIAAVAMAGLIAGSMKLPYEETIKQFKNDLTLMALSLVFILLAASMDLASLMELGWQAPLVVLLLMFVIRPLAVTLSTWGTALTWSERAFIAWMGPRGIVAASMASLMAIELKAWGIQGGEAIGPLVFLTVIMTVLIEGSGAGWVASRLNVMPKKILIVGGDEIARKLGKQLSDEGEAVTLIDFDPENVREAVAAGLNAETGDATEPTVLAKAGAGWCQALVVATPSDKANLLVTQTARGKYPALRLVARVNDSRNAEAFREAGIETLATSDAAAMTLSTLVTRPMVLPLLRASEYGDMVVEVRVGNARLNKQSVSALDLPKDCLIALLKRGGKVLIPDGKTVIELGDTVTLIGLKGAVDQSRTLLESDV